MAKYKDLNKELIKLVDEKKSAREIGEILNISYRTVHLKLRKLNINLVNYHNRLKFDNKVFDKIDSEEKAYWLGFLYADGCVYSRNNSVELSLCNNDIEHLKKFNKFLKNEIDVIVSKVNYKYTRCRVIVTNKYFHNRLVELGCIPNKSLILKFPNLDIFEDKDLIRHFIRGYVDGDGCISKKKKQKNSIRLEILGTKEFLSELNNQLNYQNKKLNKHKNIYRTIWCGKKAKDLINYLYNNANILLERKFAVLSSNI